MPTAAPAPPPHCFQFSPHATKAQGPCKKTTPGTKAFPRAAGRVFISLSPAVEGLWILSNEKKKKRKIKVRESNSPQNNNVI